MQYLLDTIHIFKLQGLYLSIKLYIAKGKSCNKKSLCKTHGLLKLEPMLIGPILYVCSRIRPNVTVMRDSLYRSRLLIEADKKQEAEQFHDRPSHSNREKNCQYKYFNKQV